MTTCSVETCQKPVSARGLCRTHYQRYLRGTPLDKPIQQKSSAPSDGKCTVIDCDRPHAARGYCTTHLARQEAGKPVAAPVREYVAGSLADRMDHYTDRSNSSGCWLWTGTDDGNGYGLVWDGAVKKNCYAHVVAWELANGEDAGERVVRHECDTPLCVKPEDLVIGTPADNVHDCLDRARRNSSPVFARGQLSPDEVREIRRLHKEDGLSNAAIAPRFNTTRATVSRVVRRLVFADIE